METKVSKRATCAAIAQGSDLEDLKGELDDV